MRLPRKAWVSEAWVGAGLFVAMCCVLGVVWLPVIPNDHGMASADYAFWLPNLLAGYFWYLRNGLFALPWFTPAECAGVPFQADPQLGYLSLPQFLSFVTDPLSAVRISLFIYAGVGFGGTWWLARRAFALSAPASLLAAGLFMLNGFFSARMAVGHLAFAPYMLLPAFCGALLPRPGGPAMGMVRSAVILRAVLAGLLLAAMIQSGMLVLLPQVFVCTAAIVLLWATLFGWSWVPVVILGGGVLLGLGLCAGKLVATLAFLSHFPRENYPLPGVRGLAATIYVAVRALFWPFGTALRDWVVNTPIIQDPHEFAFGVGLAPPLLMAAALAMAWSRSGWRALLPRRRALAAGLALIIALPIALNCYAPGWNALLKSLPILHNSSSLLRWFVVLILPAIIGAALALDRLARAGSGRAWALAAAALALTVGGVAGTDMAPYGSAGLGMYTPTDVTQAWQHAHDTGAPLPIRAVAQLFNGDHRPLFIPDRQNAMAHGYSVLTCYDPVFGYRLENLPFGPIRLAPAMYAHDGVLNFKNPACYVFPGANQCAPGDQFGVAQADALQRFLNYQSYDFAKPLGARLADWVSFVLLFGVPLVGLWSGWLMWRAR